MRASAPGEADLACPSLFLLSRFPAPRVALSAARQHPWCLLMRARVLPDWDRPPRRVANRHGMVWVATSGLNYEASQMMLTGSARAVPCYCLYNFMQ